jgi:hypothetical protein
MARADNSRKDTSQESLPCSRRHDYVLFTDGTDTDGVGCAVLAKLAFGDNVKIIYPKYPIRPGIKNFLANHKHERYPHTYFITDLWPGGDIASEKVKVFDHHGYTDSNPHDCATSLFCNYLVGENKLQPTKAIDNFVELTRLFDTFEWRNTKNDAPYYQHLLFKAWGRERYIEVFFEKLRNNLELFLPEDLAIVDAQQKIVVNTCKEIADATKIVTIDGCQVLLAECPLRYRNELRDYFFYGTPIADALIILITDKPLVLYRSLKNDCDISIISRRFGARPSRNGLRADGYTNTDVFTLFNKL